MVIFVSGCYFLILEHLFVERNHSAVVFYLVGNMVALWLITVGSEYFRYAVKNARFATKTPVKY